MRHLNFPKTQPPYNPHEWTGVDPRYSHMLEVPTTAPIEVRAAQAQARRWHYLDNTPALQEHGLDLSARSCAYTATPPGRICGVPYSMPA